MKIRNEMIIAGELAERHLSKRAQQFISESDPFNVALDHVIASDDPREIRDDYYVQAFSGQYVLVGHSIEELQNYIDGYIDDYGMEQDEYDVLKHQDEFTENCFIELAQGASAIKKWEVNYVKNGKHMVERFDTGKDAVEFFESVKNASDC